MREALCDERKVSQTPRPPWTSSRVVGTPEPAPPYTVEPAFTGVHWKNPIFAIREPGSDNLVVVEWPQPITPTSETDKPTANKPAPPTVSARALRVLDRASQERTSLFLKLDGRAIYSLAFHPNYEKNGHVYVCSKAPPDGAAGFNKLSRFTVTRGVAKEGESACDPASEEVLLKWPSGGHDGAAVVFGHDGMLYVSLGDGTADSDDNVTAQDIRSLLGKILRIEVDRPTSGKPYSIPTDNPFLGVEGARGEIWSLGHRNPWRMTIDEKTGGLWVGNNGQDLWEFAHLIKRGDNCGWSIYEGSHPFYLNRGRGPGRFVPPTIEHDHGSFRSLTGGVVYYGRQLPDIQGGYVYGDYSTGAIWAAAHDEHRVVWKRELARTTLNIVAFATSHRDDLLVLDYASGIYRLVKSSRDDSHTKFPKRLSETGLFANVAGQIPASGVTPYSVTASGWNDGALAERLVALPGNSKIQRVSANQWEFPEAAVLVQTLSLPRRGNGAAVRRVETRILTKQKGVWAGYSYVWNEAQDDATLAPIDGSEVRLTSATDAKVAGKTTENTWKVPSRADCMSCHSRAANFILGLNELQSNLNVKDRETEINQLALLEGLTVIDRPMQPTAPGNTRLVNPYSQSDDLETRARSYLHVNCSPCHMEAGGGNSRVRLNIERERDQMQLVGAAAQHQTFDATSGMLVAPGNPQQSILYHRISRRGPGQMPPRGTHVVDEDALKLIHEWIRRVPPNAPFVKDWTIDDMAEGLDSEMHGRSYETGSRLFQEIGCAQCHRFASSGGGAGPDLSGIGTKRSSRELLESIIQPSLQIATGFATTVVITTDGQVVEGRVIYEVDQKLILQPADPLTTPITISSKGIDEKHASNKSTMPEDLVNTLHKSELLDLLAYVISDANSKHSAFAK